jgi:hypothetical protein
MIVKNIKFALLSALRELRTGYFSQNKTNKQTKGRKLRWEMMEFSFPYHFPDMRWIKRNSLHKKKHPDHI